MKKRLLSLALALAMCLTLIPLSASAATPSALKKDFLNNGALSTAEAPYVLVEENGVLRMYYYQTPELQALALEMQRQGGAFYDAYQLHDIVTFIQIDAKFDNGKWLSEMGNWNSMNEWGDADFGSSVENGYAFELRHDKNSDDATRLLSFEQADPYYMSDDGDDYAYLRPYVTNTADGKRFNLGSHTISFRIRWGVQTIESGTETRDYFFGGWSPATSIGKNGTQQPLVKPTKLDAPKLSQFSLVTGTDGKAFAQYFVEIPNSVYAAERYHSIIDSAFEPLYIQAQVKVNGGEWTNTYTANASTMTNGLRTTGSENIKKDDKVQIRVRIETAFSEGNSEWSNVVGNVAAHQASDWAQEWMTKADALDLIPDSLKGQDLTKSITRAEFAAVCVKLYENLSGTKTTPVAVNPFTDTKDVEVLKAFNVGITKGTSDTTFTPNNILSRQECATMLTRVYKKVAIAGWTMDKDADFTAQFKTMFTMPPAFADDAQIDSWAKDSVYFMKAKNIIDGVGNNMFAPKHGTTANEAASYGLATREQALKLAVAMAENLK